MEDVLDRVDAALTRMVEGRDWLVATDVLVQSASICGQLRERGARRCFALGAQRGTGKLPDPEDLDQACLDLPPADSMMEAIRKNLDALQDLPQAVLARIDAVDPERRMHVLGTIFSAGKPVAGRPFFASRPQAWQALEDKVVIDAVWDAVGIPRAPSEVCPVDPERLDAAAARLDRGLGTVWAADAREGFHGGGQGTFHVHDAASRDHALTSLSRQADRARVMPFLDGLPCSIHGLVFPEHVVTTRPAEMFILRRPRDNGFFYARSGASWLPPEPVLEALRDLAVRVGRHLRQSVDYRGAFTVDGVLTRDGFRPTELNPRVGAALGQVMPGLDGYLLNAALVERVDLGIDPVELEEGLRRRSFATPNARASMMSPTVFTESQEQALRWDGLGWSATDDPDAAEATAAWGPGGTGGMLFLRFHREYLELGPSLAPRVAAFVDWADRELGADLGPVVGSVDPGSAA